MRRKLINRIERLRKDWAKAKQENNFSRCIYLDGAIFHLEKVLKDLSRMPSKTTVKSNLVRGHDLKCKSCGGVIGWCECS